MLRTVKKQFGQHFLADPNILGVIARLAELGPDDVVLEVGPGEGVLTRYLAERVARVYAVEIDRDLEPALRDIAPNVDVVFGDALQLALPGDATKLVANLPYNVATPIVVESLDGLPSVFLKAAKAGLKEGDRIVELSGKQVKNLESYMVLLAGHKKGEPLELGVLRDGKKSTFKLNPEY